MVGMEGWHLGNTGILFFIQNHIYPSCPLFGKAMQFLCQFNLDELGNGMMYIFIEKDSKTLAVFTQNT